MKTRRRFTSLWTASVGVLLLSPFAWAQRPMPAVVPSSSFQINISPVTGVPQSVVDAFNAAAALWKPYIANNMTVNIEVAYPALGLTGQLGKTTNVEYPTNYTDIRAALYADAGIESDDFILLNLPATNAFTIVKPTAFSPLTTTTDNVAGMYVTGANAKAVGLLSGSNLAIDAYIDFNSSYNANYDFDGNPDGTHYDFITLAAHEIGHALGFITNVDYFDASQFSTYAYPLDLFRFADNTVTTGTFATKERNLVPGTVAYFDDSEFEYSMSTGTVAHGGDGAGAGHWKDGLAIGLMDPTLPIGIAYGPNSADLRALDLIGYNIDFSPVPEISTLSTGLLLAGGLLRRRRS